MITRTLTQPECLALTVRGDVPGVLAPGVLVEMDWTESDGEAEETRRVSGVVVANLPDEHGDARVLWHSTDPRIGLDNRAAMFLRVPVAGNEAHLVGWLGRGEKCPCDGKPVACCVGCGHYPDDPEVRQPCAGNDAGHTWIDRDCERCNGTSWIRRPLNCYAWLLPEAHGGLPDWIRLALIWGSVVRVAAGMGPLQPDVYMPRYEGARVGYLGDVLADRRATLHVDEPRTPEACEACWLSLGIALIDNTPTGRVIRFEVPNG